ncbi:MAG: rnpA [Chlamydiia bacterium]|nr:rnpA [Chlamydiia bacterium]
MAEHLFPKTSRLLKRREYLTLQQKGQVFYGKHIIIQWRKNLVSRPRIGITITKKFGKAHARNRFKRLVREAFRLTIKPPLGIDFVVLPRKGFESFSLSILLLEVSKFFTSVQLSVLPQPPK